MNPARTITGATPALALSPARKTTSIGSAAVNPGGVPLFRNGELVGGVGVAGSTPDVTEYAAFVGSTTPGFGANPAAPGVAVIDGISLPFVKSDDRTGAGRHSQRRIHRRDHSAGAAAARGRFIAITGGTVGTLTQADVQSIMDKAVATANITRAVIRLPLGQRARFAIAVCRS